MIRKMGMMVCAGAVLVSACGKERPTAIPPFMAPAKPRVKIEPKALRMRLAMFNFIDQTGYAGGEVNTGSIIRADRAGQTLEKTAAEKDAFLSIIFKGGLVQSIPDAFAGVLSQSGRFEVNEVPQLHNRSQKEIDSSLANQACDAYVDGAITSITRSELTVDVRLISCFSKLVMSSVTSPLKYTLATNEVTFDRDDLKKLVNKLVGTLPDPREIKKGRIESREGRYVTINLGRDDRIMKGMNAFAVSYGDQQVDQTKPDTLGNEVFVAELYVFAVYPKTARAFIQEGNVRVGDYVVFK